jgi:hypothetical protein
MHTAAAVYAYSLTCAVQHNHLFGNKLVIFIGIESGQHANINNVGLYLNSLLSNTKGLFGYKVVLEF